MPSSLHVDGNRTWGGGQEQSLGLARALAARGEQVWFVAQAGSALAARLCSGDLPWESRPLRGLSGLAAAPKLAKRLREMRPEIVHIHDAASHVTVGWAARRAESAKIIVTRRTALPFRGGPLRQFKYRHWCDRLICISDAVRRQCLAGGIADDRLVVIPDSVDCQYFDQGGAGPEHTEGPPSICMVGRLSREKGHRVLLQAMRVVMRSLPEAQLLICGDGPERASLMRQAEGSGLAGNVRFLGFLCDFRSVLAAASVFVMPSLSEGLGVAVLEAMAMGKAVVASDAGGLPESVVDGETGLIVPAGDSDALAKALLALLGDPDRARLMGEAGRARAVSRFARPRVVDRILALYQEVLAGG